MVIGNGQPKLLPQHLEDLRKSGLNDAQIAACGFYSEGNAGVIRRLLNQGPKFPDVGPCLVIPYRKPDGYLNGYCRLKPDQPRKAADGDPIKYEAPVAHPNHVFLPPYTTTVLADRSAPLLATEGEKKAAAADQYGFPCLGFSGVWNWTKGKTKSGERALIDDLDVIDWTGRRCYVAFDSDRTTNPNVLAAEAELVRVLADRGADVRVVELPPRHNGSKVGLDDFLLSHSAGELQELLNKALRPDAPGATVPDSAPPDGEPPWPDPLCEEAFHGLAGKIVRTIEPASEADPAALLAQILVAFGNVIGRSAHFVVEGSEHYTNEFAVLVGRTSKARKGTSWDRVKALFRGVDEVWAAGRVPTGLSSGEGLIWAVRDRIMKRERVKERGVVCYEEVEADPGVPDKRLLVYEPEFANVLKQTERQGNTLSAVLRQAWDGGTALSSMTKNSPARATGAHVSMVGHITTDELRRYLSATESANGFGNRYLWLCAQRSKLLPEGGTIDPAAWAVLKNDLAAAITFARSVKEVRRDDEARAVWCAVYGCLSEGRPGLAGALLARAEAHVLRLAMLYALLDRSALIRGEHLLAALALWDYCERSIRFIFGDSTGDPFADELLRLLRANPGGLTRNELRDYFSRNQSSERIGRALGLLLQYRLARRQEVRTGGRPAERWFATAGRPGQ